MGRSRALVAIAFGAGILGAPAIAHAHGWCRTTTDKEFVPTADVPCDLESPPLFWVTSCVGFSLQRLASPAQAIDLEHARNIASLAFSQWSANLCPADVDNCPLEGVLSDGYPSISGQDIGPVSCDQVEYNDDAGNANIIVFRDSNWPHDDPDVTLALTTVEYNPNTGEIYGADMEINSDPTVNTITTTDTNVVYDLQSIMTHESGHFFGLAHSTDTTATMFAAYQEGAVFMRDLARDDMCAICAAYPSGRASTCDPTPRHGFALTCGGGDVPPKRGCDYAVDTSRSRVTTLASFAAIGAVALAIGIARRSRASR